jgi:hypothetical protein
MLEFKKMFKLLSFNKEIFEIKTTPCTTVVGGVFYRIFKVLVLIYLTPLYLLLTLSLFLSYLCAFFFKIPTKLISSIRKDNTPEEDKLVYTVTSIILYCLVAGFELLYIVVMFYSAVVSFVIDIVTWCICLGRRTNKALTLTFASECEEVDKGILHLVISLGALFSISMLTSMLIVMNAELIHELDIPYELMYINAIESSVETVVAALVLIYSFALNKKTPTEIIEPKQPEVEEVVAEPQTTYQTPIKEKKVKGKSPIFLILMIVSLVLFAFSGLYAGINLANNYSTDSYALAIDNLNNDPDFTTYEFEYNDVIVTISNESYLYATYDSNTMSVEFYLNTGKITVIDSYFNYSTYRAYVYDDHIETTYNGLPTDEFNELNGFVFAVLEECKVYNISYTEEIVGGIFAGVFALSTVVFIILNNKQKKKEIK